MNNKYLTLSVVAIVVFAAVAVSLTQHQDSDNGGDDGEKYEFTDSKGINHSVSVPISNVSVVHKYIPIFMKILGVEDEVAGLDSTYGMEFSSYFKNSFTIGTYSEPDGSTMISHGSKIILTPVTMGLSNAGALGQLGIEIIYLDLTDQYFIEENLKILVNLFGATEEVKENYDKYVELFRECNDFVDTLSFESTENDDFALFMASSGFHQTHASSAVKVIESISGKSFTHKYDPNTSETVYFTLSPSVLVDFDGKEGLEYVFIYGLDTPDENYRAFMDYDINGVGYSNMTCVKSKNTYVISTNCVNGAISCVSLILYAKAFGAGVGDKAEEIVQKFNDYFGLNYDIKDLIKQVA